MATAIAHPNIALIKYWGKRDRVLNLPSTSSISLTLDTFETKTSVQLGSGQDLLVVNGRALMGKEAERVFNHLDLVVPGRQKAQVVSESNFPMAAGLASSSSAFAALTVAAIAEAGLEKTPEEMSILARQGSGSACRSLWGGWVEWHRGMEEDGTDSHGKHLAPRDHWDVRMVVAVVAGGKKKISSREGMLRTMQTSPMYAAWVNSYERDMRQARQAILEQDLEALGVAMERSTLKMHSTMMTSEPPIRYWRGASVALMDAIENLRAKGIGAWWTMDAGPNVKVLCEAEDAERVAAALGAFVQQVSVLAPGGPPRLV
ncbi:MAG: diphosphomevalonate decarboxylase [Proteobacteria bacterium]|nr:diphosphomevalonate decarboxylase [Pseudomonadota bacterium]MCP4918960.1 diphosphomevalonate decarboxylase [Pseudomonadota bacterium]